MVISNWYYSPSQKAKKHLGTNGGWYFPPLKGLDFRPYRQSPLFMSLNSPRIWILKALETSQAIWRSIWRSIASSTERELLLQSTASSKIRWRIAPGDAIWSCSISLLLLQKSIDLSLCTFHTPNPNLSLQKSSKLLECSISPYLRGCKIAPGAPNSSMSFHNDPNG